MATVTRNGVTYQATVRPDGTVVTGRVVSSYGVPYYRVGEQKVYEPVGSNALGGYVGEARAAEIRGQAATGQTAEARASAFYSAQKATLEAQGVKDADKWAKAYAAVVYNELTGGYGTNPYGAPRAPSAQGAPQAAELTTQEIAKIKQTTAQAMARTAPVNFTLQNVLGEGALLEQQISTYDKAVAAYNAQYGGKDLDPNTYAVAVERGKDLQRAAADIEAKSEFVSGQYTAYNKMQAVRTAQSAAVTAQINETDTLGRVKMGYYPDVNSPDWLKAGEARVGLGLIGLTDSNYKLGKDTTAQAFNTLDRFGLRVPGEARRLTGKLYGAAAAVAPGMGQFLFGVGQGVKMGAEGALAVSRNPKEFYRIAAPAAAGTVLVGTTLAKEIYADPAGAMAEALGATVMFTAFDYGGAAAARAAVRVTQSVASAAKVASWQAREALELRGVIKQPAYFYKIGEPKFKQYDLTGKFTTVAKPAPVEVVPSGRVQPNTKLPGYGFIAPTPAKPITKPLYLQVPTKQLTLPETPVSYGLPKGLLSAVEPAPLFPKLNQRGSLGMGLTSQIQIRPPQGETVTQVLTRFRAVAEPRVMRPELAYLPRVDYGLEMAVTTGGAQQIKSDFGERIKPAYLVRGVTFTPAKAVSYPQDSFKLPKQGSRQAAAFSQLSIQVVTPATISPTKTITFTPPRLPQKIKLEAEKIKVIPAMAFTSERSEYRQQLPITRAYKLLVKSGGEWRLKASGLPYGKAMARGVSITEETPARSFKLLQAGFTTQEDRPRPSLANFYKRQGTYIEKVKAAINTGGELRGISAKGWAAPRTKKLNKFKRFRGLL